MPNRYRKAKDCMESISARKRRCEFPMLGLGVHCECYAAMECPAAREVTRLQSERPSHESCGREDRCEWKKTSIDGHKAAISRAEKAEEKAAKAEADVERYRALHEVERGVCEHHCDTVRDLKAEVERLRALCAERPPYRWNPEKEVFVVTDELMQWCERIDAAGRGEG